MVIAAMTVLLVSLSRHSALDGAGGQAGNDPSLEHEHDDNDGDGDNDGSGHDGRHRRLELDWPVKNDSAAGTVRALFVEVSEAARRNSFQQ